MGGYKEDVGKHGKFDHIWFGPFKITATKGKNSFLLENLDGEILDTPINERYLKHFMQWSYFIFPLYISVWINLRYFNFRFLFSFVNYIICIT
jgi:hypothetical protein